MTHLYQHLAAPLLITASGAHGYLPVVMNALKGISKIDALASEMAREVQMSTSISASTNQYTSSNDEKHVAVISLIGAITKYDQACGPQGILTKERELNSALDNPECAGVILRIDSPGGSAAYLENFSRTIKKANKPIIAYVEGCAASAAYWIASATNEIYLSSSLDSVGSIGAYVTVASYYEKLKKEGIDLREIYGTKSTLKNKAYRDLFKEDANENEMQSHIDKLVDNFISHVSNTRNIVDANAFKGKMYEGDGAIEAGLADGYKNLGECAKRIIDLSEKNNHKSMKTTEKTFPKLNTLLDFEEGVAINFIDGSASLQEDVLDSIEEKLTAYDDLKVAFEAQKTEIANLKEDVLTNKSIVDAALIISEASADDPEAVVGALNLLKKERDEFAKKPSSTPTTAKGNDDYSLSEYDGHLSHNRLADKYLKEK